MHRLVAIALIVGSMLGCAEATDNSHELARLTVEKEALQAEVTQYESTVERLETEVRTLSNENADLRDQLEMTRLDLEQAKKERNVEFVERVVERPASDERGEAPPPAGSAINPIDEKTGLQILSATARATEKNNSWWRFGWVVSIANHSGETRDFKLQVQFMDADGFVVDDDTEYGLTIPPMQNRTFRESSLVRLPSARRVTSVNPIIKY